MTVTITPNDLFIVRNHKNYMKKIKTLKGDRTPRHKTLLKVDQIQSKKTTEKEIQ